MRARTIFTTLTILLTAITASAQVVFRADSISLYTRAASPAGGDSIGVTQATTPSPDSPDSIQLTLALHFSGAPLARQQAYIVTPRLTDGRDSIDFPSVGIYGHDIYYHYLRTGLNIFQGDDDYMIRAKYCPLQLDYVRGIAYQPWMQCATLKLIRTDITACGDIADTDSVLTYTRDYTYTALNETEQHQDISDLSGTARIEFIVNRTELRPDHRRNARELQTIRQAIESITSDTTLELHHISLTGYASPEGPYDNNERLAAGRTESLRQYLASLMRLDTALITTSSVAEDWEGTRRYVADSRLPHRDDILRLIDTPLEADAKLARIRSLYPADYATILADCFPALRRTDYAIAYTRRRTWEEQHHVATDTACALPQHDFLPETEARLRPYRAALAIKTNMLFDAALCPNVELEVAFGRNRQWSIMGEYWFPWYVWRHNSNAYELIMGGGELRYWWSRCNATRAPLTGNFLGLYGAGGYYDFEWHSEGEQGEFASVGITFGHSWAVRRRLNLELSVSAGAIWGPQRHYHGEFNDTHLIWKYNHNLFYAGPTKLKFSLVWLLFNTYKRKEGGRQ